MSEEVGAPPDEEPRRAARLVWIAPAVALAATAMVVAALSYFDTNAPSATASIEVKLGAAVPKGPANADPALVEQSPDGPLPIVGADGRQPWQVYARPFDAKDTRPRLAIVVGGLGLDAERTKAAIDSLPPQISLVFSPYAKDLDQAIAAAHAKGHEVLLGLPLEPGDYPASDPGPDTLLTSLSAAENIGRLHHVMGRAAGYVGFVGLLGDRFTADSASLEPVLEELKKRGLLYIDDNDPQQSAVARLAQMLGMAWAVADRRIDADAESQAVDRSLAQLEAQAKSSGAALGLGLLYPVTIERVADWAKTLDTKGIALAPATAIVHRQSLAQQEQ